MTAKLMVTASDNDPPLVLERRTTEVPAPTETTWHWYEPAVPPDPWLAMTTSVALMALLVIVNWMAVLEARAALCVVMTPALALTTTVVDLLVPWVTVPKAAGPKPMAGAAAIALLVGVEM